MKEFIDEEKSRVEKVEVKPIPGFDRGDDGEQAKAIDEDEDLTLGTIHMIKGPKHTDLKNRIWGRSK